MRGARKALVLLRESLSARYTLATLQANQRAHAISWTRALEALSHLLSIYVALTLIDPF